MAARLKWVFLLYRLPRDPSTPRIALWRTLRRLRRDLRAIRMRDYFPPREAVEARRAVEALAEAMEATA